MRFEFDLQKVIQDKFPAQLKDAEARLCHQCKRYSVADYHDYKDCYLQPLTSEGKDCPYFEKLGGK